MSSFFGVAGAVILLTSSQGLAVAESVVATWTEHQPSQKPSARWMYGMSYDPGVREAVLFGGALPGSGTSDETWAYNYTTDTWTKLNPAGSPGQRSAIRMVFDDFAGRHITFGGINTGSPSCRSDTWAFDRQNVSWLNRAPITAFNCRNHYALSYDVQARKTVLFGGVNWTCSCAVYNDTWEYDFGTDQWSSVSPSVSPPVRSSAEMVYDEESGVTVLFGGARYYSGAVYYYTDTWVYWASNNTWKNVTPQYTPPGRAYPAMHYDRSSDLVFMFGGYSPVVGDRNDTWAYDHNRNNWSLVATANAPSPRRLASTAHDPVSDSAVLFGGLSASVTALGDTWIFEQSGPIVPQFWRIQAFAAASVAIFGCCCLSPKVGLLFNRRLRCAAAASS
jgi:hypothetical protein